jgi:hypothetical protein
MAKLINIPTFKDKRGDLSVLEDIVPYPIERVYYIYNVTEIRGGHRHRKTIQTLICLGGSCDIYCNNGKTKRHIL